MQSQHASKRRGPRRITARAAPTLCSFPTHCSVGHTTVLQTYETSPLCYVCATGQHMLIRMLQSTSGKVGILNANHQAEPPRENEIASFKADIHNNIRSPHIPPSRQLAKKATSAQATRQHAPRASGNETRNVGHQKEGRMVGQPTSPMAFGA